MLSYSSLSKRERIKITRPRDLNYRLPNDAVIGKPLPTSYNVDQ